MSAFLNDNEFAASLAPAQRDYFFGRLAEWQHQFQDSLRDLARGLSAISALNAESLTLLSADDSAPRRSLVVAGIEFRYATMPGIGRLKLSTAGGVPIAIWDGELRNPWFVPLEGYAAFLASGHAKAVHRLLYAVAARRRSTEGRRP